MISPTTWQTFPEEIGIPSSSPSRSESSGRDFYATLQSTLRQREETIRNDAASSPEGQPESPRSAEERTHTAVGAEHHGGDRSKEGASDGSRHGTIETESEAAPAKQLIEAASNRTLDQASDEAAPDQASDEATPDQASDEATPDRTPALSLIKAATDQLSDVAPDEAAPKAVQKSEAVSGAASSAVSERPPVSTVHRDSSESAVSFRVSIDGRHPLPVRVAPVREGDEAIVRTGTEPSGVSDRQAGEPAPERDGPSSRHRYRTDSPARKLPENASARIELVKPSDRQGAGIEGIDWGVRSGGVREEADVGPAEGFRQRLVRHLRESTNPEILRHARFVLRGERSGEIRLLLKPERFGMVRVQLQLQDNHIGGRIIVENSNVRDVFEQNMSGLLRAFHQSGIETTGLDVSVDDGRQQRRDRLQFGRRLEVEKLDRSVPTVHEALSEDVRIILYA